MGSIPPGPSIGSSLPVSARLQGTSSSTALPQWFIPTATAKSGISATKVTSFLCRSGEFSRPRVSNDNPYYESLFRTVKYRPNYPNRPFSSKEEACQWVSSFVDWYNHQHRHSRIKFVTPEQRHSGEAIEICRQRSRVYELARIANPKRWSRSICCWKQPDLVWINEQLATQQTSLQVTSAKEA